MTELGGSAVLRRFVFLLAASSAALAPGAAYATTPITDQACVSAAAATYRHTFDGPSGSVTVTAAKPLCSGQTQTFALASYTAGAPSSNARPFVYSTDRGSITASKRTLSLKVTLPSCYTQVEAIKGTALAYEGTNAPADLLPSATYSGGTRSCAPAPTVTFDNACDGSFTGTLANSDQASTDAVFLTGDRLLRLPPGASRTLTAKAGTTLTIRTNTFTTYAGSWRQPTDCATIAPSAAPPTTAATTTPTPTTGGEGAGAPASTPASLIPSSASTTSDLTDAGAWYPATPTTPAVATASQSSSTMSTGSVLAIALGLLLMVGGGFLLVRVLRTLREEP
ncbi:hypothetical protein [Paractinoplanes atraurantiacus]|uniref:Uncharacterized protein n=1 Tax=Paractinoplanes atraurantiacus TaxID=1036182 RepID=A0A285HCE8_9ACTN|nr:hypothetical protein [Actinoplanes atraurantiacus]SNY33324.1 hypothetical protein SAMN05421748_104118 [Actinoplanes atraurantiacus]